MNSSLDSNIELISSWPPDDVAEAVDNVGTNSTTYACQDTPRHISKIEGCSPMRKKKKFMDNDSSRSPELSAQVTLAKWWKAHGRISSQQCLEYSGSPNTTLKAISKLPHAKDFLRNEVVRLNCLLSGSGSIDIHAAIASCHELLGNTECAARHARHLLKSNSSEEEHILLNARLARQLEAKKIQDSRNASIKCSAIRFPPSVPVEVKEACDFSYQDFLFNYALTSTPVIIAGLQNVLTKVPWSFQHIKEVAGSCHFTAKKHVKSSVEWAQLEDDTFLRVGDYIDSLPGQHNKPMTEQRYLFDWSLPVHCRPLAEEITIPKYFANDFLQRTEPGSLYRESWPSLFIAPSGLCSELHVDTFGSNFWMALFQGRKRWQFFCKQDIPLLYPSYTNSLDPVFEIDLNQLDIERYPLVSLTSPRECILEPGQVLFVPAGCPHRVQNLEASLAISSNFVDISNFYMVKEELMIHQHIDSRAEDLLQQLSSRKFSLKMNGDINHTPWQEFNSGVDRSKLNY